ncbi:MAG: pilus assembly protein PilM [Deltaproteobacteria bacterium]|nr:pilus assembly protein PilM [Deltaproteobacteria bacterium]
MLIESSIGIDIKKDHLFLLHLKKTFKALIPVEHESFPLPDGKSSEDTNRLIAEIINNFIIKNSIKPDYIFLGLPRHKLLLKYTDLPLAVEENLSATLAYELGKYFPFPVDELYYDFTVINRDEQQNRLNILIAAAKKNEIDSIIQACRRTGIFFSGVAFSSTALVNAFEGGQDETDTSFMIIADIDHDQIEVNLKKNGMLRYSRHITFKNNKNISLEEILINEIEIIKQKADQTGESTDQLKIVLTGPAVSKDFFATEIPERIMKKTGLKIIKFSEITGHLLPPGFETAYGLAKKGSSSLPLNINLAPANLLKKPGRAGWNIFLILLILFFISLSGWAGSSFFQKKMLLSRINAEIITLKPEITKIDKIRKEYTDIEQKLVHINKLKEDNKSALNIINTMAAVIPKDAWVKNITLKHDTVEIEGYATIASELISVLEQSPMFKDVSFKSTIVKDKKGKERFKIGMTLN